MNPETELGGRLAFLCAEASSEVVLIAPYIKAPALARVLQGCNVEGLNCVTRWQMSDFQHGVSDLEAFRVIRDFGGKLWLHPNLHAKYYRADSRVLVGSANLTATGLGWAASPNQEILIEIGHSDPQIAGFESRIFSTVRPVDDELFDRWSEAFSLLPPPNAPIGSPVRESAAERLEGENGRRWLPQTRMPAHLFDWYQRPERSEAPSGQVERISRDLAALDVPPFLGEEDFRRVAAAALLASTTWYEIDDFVSVERRFGEVRAFLERNHSLSREEATDTWQTLIRWMRYFLPERYSHRVVRNSELVQRR